MDARRSSRLLPASCLLPAAAAGGEERAGIYSSGTAGVGSCLRPTALLSYLLLAVCLYRLDLDLHIYFIYSAVWSI